MLGIAVELLAGRYGACAYNDRAAHEWPPHPARFFSALVAAWAEADQPSAQERAVLAWLEQQGPPHVVCSESVARRVPVTFYVPVNDSAVLKPSPDARAEAVRQARQAATHADARTAARAATALRKAEAAYRQAVGKAAAGSRSESAAMMAEALEVLPERRNRQGRWFPAVTPADPVIRFVWPDARPAGDQLPILDGLLARIGRLGHSATLVTCRLDGAPPAATLVPRAGGERVLRVPRQGLLDRLERHFASHQGTQPRLLAARMVSYGRPVAARPEPVSSVLSGDWIVLDVDSAWVAGQRIAPPRVTRSLALARAVRERLLANAGPDAAGVLGGVWPDGRPRQHVAVVPLPAAGYRWADGAIRAVALMLPRELVPDQRGLVTEALRRWAADGAPEVDLPSASGGLHVAFRLPRWARAEASTEVAEWVDVAYALRRHTWCRPVNRWVSVTPVALDRRVRGLLDARPDRREPAAAAAAESVRRSCRHVGLPEPIDVELGPDGLVTAVPRAGGRHGFPHFVAAGSGEHRQCVHARLTFAEPVAGPVLVGAGRYLGYGLFLPERDDREPAR